MPLLREIHGKSSGQSASLSHASVQIPAGKLPPVSHRLDSQSSATAHDSPGASASVAQPAKCSAGTSLGVAFGQETRTLSEYIDWAVDQARRMNEIEMQVEGDIDDEKAKSLVLAMLEAGLAERL